MTSQKLEELAKKVREMHANGEYKNPEYGKMCLTVAKLIENSKFGMKNAEAELVLPNNQSNFYDQMLDDSFDGVAMQLMELANGCLCEQGSVSVEPYSQGITSRSAKLRFVKT